MSKLKAILSKRDRASHPDSTRESFYLTLELKEPLAYEPGDAIAIDVLNSDEAVTQWIEKWGYKEDDLVEHRKKRVPVPLFVYLKEEVNLYSIEEGDLTKARPLLPRFYSIASSAKKDPKKIELLISLSYHTTSHGSSLGVASEYLSKTLPILGSISFSFYRQSHFKLPQNPMTPLIMIGPGTGIAPFKAFLEERLEEKKRGKHWLFFGERNQAWDFYYRDFLQSLEKQGDLYLDLAFSRDQGEKEYVQHLIRKKGLELIRWLDEGACLYLCGSKKPMGEDVRACLTEQLSLYRGISIQQAQQELLSLYKEKRFQVDLY